MIRCVRIVADAAGHSVIEEGTIAFTGGKDGSQASDQIPVRSISFHETPAHSASAAHNAPSKQIVLSLTGTLSVRTDLGQETVMRPGDVLLAEDIEGVGHSWKLVDDDPWRRAYIVLDDDARSLFTRAD